jgi:hypothetical protein
MPVSVMQSVRFCYWMGGRGSLASPGSRVNVHSREYPVTGYRPKGYADRPMGPPERH